MRVEIKKIFQNPWMFGVGAGWILLAFIFTMYRYGERVFSSEIYSIFWNKLGNIVLLHWLSDTIVTGVLAVIAAVIGAYALFTSTQAAENLQKTSVLRKCKVHCSVIRDELNSNLVIVREDAERLMDAADQLGLVDADLAWLAICIARHVQNISRSGEKDTPKSNATYLKCAYLILLLDHVESQISVGTFVPVRKSGFVPATLLVDLEKRGLKVTDTGEFDSLFKWSARVRTHLADTQ